jgi:hypothetical protein
MHIDFKITGWERVEIPEEMEEEVLSKIKDGTITTANDIFALPNANPDGSLRCDMLPDVTESMSVEENGGASTIEAFADNQSGDLIFKNGE